MPVDPKQREQEYIDRAFELAYFIHANRGIALCVAEEAWRKLDPALDQQYRRRYAPPVRRRRRMRISMRDEHLLQCLVYAESDPWERCTEQDDSPYPLTEEDMIIRFIKHLVRISMRRNSLYVTLGVSQLLYEYGTAEVLQMYHSLLWDEFKDKSFVRQQRKVLMRDMTERFADQIQTEKTAERGERLVSQPTTPRLVELVEECLQRFTPWGTVCHLPASFSAQSQVPGLYFSGADPDEEHPIEMNRIHTILHPECFSRFIRGLGFGPPDERLAVPAFSFSTGGQPRGDRFHPPKLEEEDYLRLRRTRELDARRRRVFLARQLDLYVDGTKQASFDPRQTPRFQLKIGPEADVLEVRGQDAAGELTLAVLFVRAAWIPPGETFRDRMVLEGGQKVTIALTPVRDASGELQETHVEVSYAETQLGRALARLAQRAWFGLGGIAKRPREGSDTFGPDYWWAKRVGIAAVLVMAVATLIWFQIRPLLLKPPPPPRTEIPRPAEPAPSPSPAPSPVSPETPQLRAQVIWSQDLETVPQAMSIAPTRARVNRVDLSRQQAILLIRLSRYDEESQPYSRYRITLVASGQRLWQRTLDAPPVGLTEGEHVLKLTLFPSHLPKADTYELHVQGQSQSGWQLVGQALLQPK